LRGLGKGRGQSPVKVPEFKTNQREGRKGQRSTFKGEVKTTKGRGGLILGRGYLKRGKVGPGLILKVRHDRWERE